MSNKKSKPQKSYGEKIVSLVGKSWVSTGKIIKSVGCPPRAARRVLRGLVKSRALKSVKVQRERYFAAPGTKAAPPKVEASNKGNARPRNRSRKAAKGKKAASSGKKAKRRAPAARKTASKPVKKSVERTVNVVAAKPGAKKAESASGARGTTQSAPSSPGATSPTAATATATAAPKPTPEQTAALLS